MALQYALYNNHLTSEDDFTAKVQKLKTNSIEDIVELMTAEGSILKTTECNAVIIDFFRVLAQRIAKGEGFGSQYMSITPTIRGVFDSLDDVYDAERHSVVINLNAGKMLKEALNQIELIKVKASKPTQATINTYLDVMANSATSLSKGGLGELKGEHLKIDTEQADEGVFIINTANNQATKVSRLHQNLPSVLQFVVPNSLAAGSYAIEVRNRPFRVKELRTGKLNTTLTVA